jgi:hypothetical protein
MDDNFFVRLPFSVDTESSLNNNNNNLSNYTTKLAKRIKFPLDEKYEVALTEISYPKSYTNVQYETGANFWFDYTRITDLKPIQDKSQFSGKLDRNEINHLQTKIKEAWEETFPNYVGTPNALLYPKIKTIFPYHYPIIPGTPGIARYAINIISTPVNGWYFWPYFNSELYNDGMRILKSFQELNSKRLYNNNDLLKAVNLDSELSRIYKLDLANNISYGKGQDPTEITFYWIDSSLTYDSAVQLDTTYRSNFPIDNLQIGFWIDSKSPILSFFEKPLVINSGYYDNRNLIDMINYCIENYFDSMTTIQQLRAYYGNFKLPSLIFDAITNKVIIKPAFLGHGKLWISFDDDFCDYLSLPRLNKLSDVYKNNLEKEKDIFINILKNKNKIYQFSIESIIESFGPIALQQPGIYFLYIYCDLVKPSFVGNSYGRLLRIVEVLKDVKFSNQSIVRYNTPQYIQVDQNEIENIKINICDENGKEISFISGRLLVTLHFRKVNEK